MGIDNNSPIISPPDESAEGVCNKIWIGDGNCDLMNNKLECEYDGGDCCRKTCLKNCENNGACIYKCGDLNGYNCMESGVGCSSCQHGVCNIMNSCMVNTQRILSMIDSCYLEPWSQGNYNTVNFTCGRSETDINSAFSIDQCTARACCVDFAINRIESSNCDNTTSKNFIIGNPLTLQDTVVSGITCIQFAAECFRDNMKYRGQCCECDAGWIGYDCNTPICNPRCIRGTCVDFNVCQCESDNWIGPRCSIPICKESCIHGVCTNEDHCECFYGYTGRACNIGRV